MIPIEIDTREGLGVVNRRRSIRLYSPLLSTIQRVLMDGPQVCIGFNGKVTGGNTLNHRY